LVDGEEIKEGKVAILILMFCLGYLSAKTEENYKRWSNKNILSPPLRLEIAILYIKMSNQGLYVTKAEHLNKNSQEQIYY
jgi:hypothetical protein